MLDARLWAALDLKPDVLARRAQFFLAYAASLDHALPFDIDGLIRRAEAGGVGNGEPVTWLEEPDDLEASELETVAADTPRRELAGMRRAMRADAYREATLATLTLDVREGLSLLLRSGRDYLAADVPYGMFLLGIVEPSRAAPATAAETLGQAWPGPVGLEITFRDGEPGEREDRPVPPLDPIGAAARDPAQQVYLALSASQDPAVANESRELFDRFAEQPQARSPLAFGSTGLPLAEWWDLIKDMRSPEMTDKSRKAMGSRLRLFAIEHGRMLARAQGTDQWAGGHVAVDIVDLDIAAATCFALRSLERHGAEPLREDDFADVPPLGRISLSVGLEMANAGNAPTDADDMA